MSFEYVDSVLNVSLNNITVLALAALLLLFGHYAKSKVNFLARYCVPTPVVGGFSFAILAFILQQANIVKISMDTSFQTPFMLVFFATVGLGASTKLLARGGKKLVVYLILCVVVVVFQNVISVGLAIATGMSPMHGVMMGSQTLAGGHGGAVSYGNQLDAMGYAGSTLVGLASATFGVIFGSLVGGPLGRRLISQYHLKSDEGVIQNTIAAETKNEKAPLSLNNIVAILALTFLAVAVGDFVCKFLTNDLNFTTPSTMGAMLFGAIIRNLNDKLEFVNLDERTIDVMSETSLGLFLSMSMVSLSLSDLVSLALPMLLILSINVSVLALYAYFVVFRVLGRNYDAAVMCAGMMGHGLGATPNAMANMGAITEEYGPSATAYMVVPVVGAFLLDFVANVPMTTLLINILK